MDDQERMNTFLTYKITVAYSFIEKSIKTHFVWIIDFIFSFSVVLIYSI